MSCAQYILLLMFCGLGQHSGYSNLLWAGVWDLNPGVGEFLTSPDWPVACPASCTRVQSSFPMACSRVKFNSFFIIF